MNCIIIENRLYDIQRRLCHYSDLTTAKRAIAPLTWYVGTDRAPLDFIRTLCNANSRQITTIAKRLFKMSGGDYSAIIDDVTSYLNKRQQEVTST